MKREDYMRLAQLLYDRQHGRCAVCGLPLHPGAGERFTVEIAHVISRGEIVRHPDLGKAYEWHPELVALVCTRKGKTCNDAVLIGKGHPVARQALIDRVKGTAQPFGEEV